MTSLGEAALIAPHHVREVDLGFDNAASGPLFAHVEEGPLKLDAARALMFGTATGAHIASGATFFVGRRTAQPTVPGEVALTPVRVVECRPSGSTPTPAAAAPPSSSQSNLSTPVGGPVERILKRIVDIVVAVLGLLLLGPLIIVLAVAVGLTSRGPMFYRQERVGRFGTRFVINKIRTMKVNNDDSEHRRFVESLLLDPDARPVQDGTYKLFDHRVTGIGAILRRFSLDELPQLWNVLKGDMSLVGPRPLLPWEWELVDGQQRQRVRARPGCTGLWQVSGRNLVSPANMLELDLDYVRRWSLRRDMSIMIRTPRAVLRGDGAR